MNVRRAAAPLLIAALLLGAGHTLPATGGPTTKTYSDRTHTLTLQYPATWKGDPHSPTTDAGYFATIAKTYAFFYPRDNSSIFEVAIGNKTPAGAALKAWELKDSKDGTTPAGPTATGRMTIGKISFYRWSAKIVNGAGAVVVDTIYTGTGSGGTYYIETVIFDHPATSAKALQGILDSVTIR